MIIRELNSCINMIMKNYQKKQKKELEKRNMETNQDHQSIRDSKEVVLLRNYRWVLLKNYDDISHSVISHYHSRLGMTLDTFQIEKMFLELDPNFSKLRKLKEMLIDFNSASYGSEDEIYEALDHLHDVYVSSEISMFRKFAMFIRSNRDSIVHSFTVVPVARKSKKDASDYYARLSNGPVVPSIVSRWI